MDSLKSEGIKAFAWSLLGRFSTQGISFAITIILARLLEPTDFGLIAILLVFVGIAQVFVDMGLGSALIQRRRSLPIHYNSVFFFNITIALCLTSIVFLSSHTIGEFYNAEELVPLTQAISIIFIINSLSTVQVIQLRKKLNYALLTKAGVSSSILSGLIGVGLAYNNFGVWSLVGQIITQGLFNNAILWKNSTWKPSLSFSFKALKQLWGFGFLMFISSLIDTIFTRIDFLIFGKLFPPATLGYYQRAKQFNNLIIQQSSGSLMAVMFPVLSKIQNDLPRFKSVILKSLNVLSCIVFLLIGIIYINAEELVIILFSEKWLPSVKYMEILILSGFAIPLSSLLVNILSSRGNAKGFLSLDIIKRVFHSINLINAFYNGIESYLFGLIIVSSISVGLNIFFAHKEVKIPIQDFIIPIFTQLLISFISAVTALQIFELFPYGLLLGFIIKVMSFLIIFLSINIGLKTRAYSEIACLIIPMTKKIFTKLDIK